MFAGRVLSSGFLALLHSSTACRVLLQPTRLGVAPLSLVGTPRAIREAVCNVFKAVVDLFFHGNFQAVRLTVQFKARQVGKTKTDTS